MFQVKIPGTEPFRRSFYFCFRKLQQTKNLIACRHTVHRNMEKAAELAHRNKEVRCDQHDKQTSGKRHLSRRQLRHRNCHSGCSTSIGNQIHNRDGVELHRQHLHRNFAELLGFPIHLLLFPAIRFIYFQCSQSLQIFQKRITEAGVLPPIFR